MRAAAAYLLAGSLPGPCWSPRGSRPEPVGKTRRGRGPDGARNADVTRGKEYGGGAAAQPDADGGTACLAYIARTGAPRGAAPPHSVTIQACRNMYKS
jgi:hypothetical protein